jgi:hypothetical protein
MARFKRESVLLDGCAYGSHNHSITHYTAVMTFENEAREERAFYDSLSISEIHSLIHERKFGRTGMLWQSLRERGNLVQSAWVLLELLERRSVDRDIRRQAAGVLLHMLDSHEWSPEALSDDNAPEFESRMREARNAVNSKIREMTR